MRPNQRFRPTSLTLRASAAAELPRWAPKNEEHVVTGPVYALNLFNVKDKAEYIAYSRGSAKEVASHGGRVVALGKFQEAATGNIEPREVLILVEWKSREAFESYRNDPRLADLHPHRVNGTADYIWHLYDKIEDLRPILK